MLVLRGEAGIGKTAMLDAAARQAAEARVLRVAGAECECLDDQDILLGTAALRLHVSPRTLQRLLEREGTTWRSEVDAARCEQARRLRQAGATSSQAASRLGYSDARSLRRAARRRQRSRVHVVADGSVNLWVPKTT